MFFIGTKYEILALMRHNKIQEDVNEKTISFIISVNHCHFDFSLYFCGCPAAG